MIYVLMITQNNRNELLKRALRSVLSQVGPGLEFKLVLCENGDVVTDPETVALLTDPRVIRLPTESLTISKARNRMAALVGPTDSLMFADDDDYLLPGCLWNLNDVLPPGGLAYGDCRQEESDGNLWLRRSCSVEYSKEAMLTVCCIFHPALMTKSLFTTVGGLNEALPCHDFYDLGLRISEVPNVQVYHLKRPLYVYNDLDNHVSTRSGDRAPWMALVRANAVARRAAAPQ